MHDAGHMQVLLDCLSYIILFTRNHELILDSLLFVILCHDGNISHTSCEEKNDPNQRASSSISSIVLGFLSSSSTAVKAGLVASARSQSPMRLADSLSREE